MTQKRRKRKKIKGKLVRKQTKWFVKYVGRKRQQGPRHSEVFQHSFQNMDAILHCFAIMG